MVMLLRFLPRLKHGRLHFLAFVDLFSIVRFKINAANFDKSLGAWPIAPLFLSLLRFDGCLDSYFYSA